MNGKTHIQLIGTPSTTFTYVQHIIEQIIDRAGLTIPIERITDISQIIDLNINVIPTLKINDREFRFHTNKNTNDILREAVLYLLQEENYGKWPVFILATDKVGDAYYLANDLAQKTNAAIEWILKDHSSNTMLIENLVQQKDLSNIIRGDKKDLKEQIFSDPLINYKITHKAAKSACLSISRHRNTLAIITDRQGTYNWPLIYNWIEYCKAPLIIASGGDHYRAPEKISVIVDNDQKCEHEILTHLVNGKKNNINQLSFTAAHSTAILDDEPDSEIEGFDYFVEDLYRSKKADLWVFQFSKKDRLTSFLKDPHIRRWMKKAREPIVFLPV